MLSKSLTPGLPSPPVDQRGSPRPPGLRLITVPDAAPPYDCETHGAGCQATRAATRAGPRSTGQSQSPGGQARSPGGQARSPGGQARSPGGQPRSPGGRSRPSRKAANVRAPAPREASPPEAAAAAAAAAETAAAAGMAAAWPGQFARVIVEILAGSRPARQLIPMTSEHARTQLGLLAPYLASDQPPRIKRVLASRPSERVVEMTVIVSCGARSRALAMRLEHMPGRPAVPGLPARPARWLCTEVETG